MPTSTSHARDRLASLHLPGTVWIGTAPVEPVRRLATEVRAFDDLLGGGLPRGRLSEIAGAPSSGRTGLMQLFLAAATRRGELAAVIDLPDVLDPPTLCGAGVDLDRVLWVRPPTLKTGLQCAELVLSAGGFALVVLDLGFPESRHLPRHVWPRLARSARRADTALAVLADRRVAGSFAALGVEVVARRAQWKGRLFDGIAPRIQILRGSVSAPETVDQCEDTLRQAQGERKKSFGGKPHTARAEPFDGAQDRLVEAPYARRSTVSSGRGD